jgi:hypothetical protein
MAILRTDIPDEALDSIDALCVWTLTAIEEMYSGQDLIREAESVVNPVILIGEYKDLDGYYRLSARVQLRLSANYQSTASQIWTDIIPIAPIALPPAFKLQISAPNPDPDPDPTLTPTPTPTPTPTIDPVLMVNGMAWSAIFEDGFYTVIRPLSVTGSIDSPLLIITIRAALFQKYGIQMDYDSYFVGEGGIYYFFYLP